MNINVTLYQTEFLDINNIPSNLSVLNSYPKKTFPAIWQLQDKILPSIRINCTYDDVKLMSFCLCNNVLYHIIGVNMINENVADINLMLEPFNTIGLNNVKSVDGVAVRLHSNENEILSNVLIEPFKPLYPLVYEMQEIKIGTDVTNFVAVTTSLDFKLDKPTVEPVKVTEIYNAVWQGQTPYRTDMKGVGLYVYDGNVQAKLNQLHKWGLSNCIVASYSIPNKFISSKTVDTSTNFVKSIYSTGFGVTSIFKAEYSTAKNKKVFSGQYNYITLVSTVSGDNKTFQPKEIYSDWQAGGYGLNVFSDISSSGKAYIRTSRYLNENRTDTSWTFGMITGGSWLNNPLTFFNKDGWGWNEQILSNSITVNSLENAFYTDSQQAQNRAVVETTGRESLNMSDLYDTQKEVNEAQKTMNNINAEATNWGSLGGLLRQAGQITASPLTGQWQKSAAPFTGYVDLQAEQQNKILTHQQIVNAQNLQNHLKLNNTRAMLSTDLTQQNIANASAVMNAQQNLMRVQYMMNNTSVPPTIKYPRTNGLSLFTHNSFFIVNTRLDDRDVKRFDKFLSLYGVATNKFISKDDFTSRTIFNYVQANIDLIEVSNTPNYLIDMLKERIRVGVRLWHQKPYKDAYLNN